MTQMMTLIDEQTISVFIPMTIRKRGGHKMVIIPEGSQEVGDHTPEINTPLLKALVRAARWERQLRCGTYATLTELVQVEHITTKYAQLILRLNFLAPDIKEAILAGKQPHDLTLADMMANIPLLWDEQRRVFKFT